MSVFVIVSRWRCDRGICVVLAHTVSNGGCAASSRCSVVVAVATYSHDYIRGYVSKAHDASACM